MSMRPRIHPLIMLAAVACMAVALALLTGCAPAPMGPIDGAGDAPAAGRRLGGAFDGTSVPFETRIPGTYPDSGGLALCTRTTRDSVIVDGRVLYETVHWC